MVSRLNGAGVAAMVPTCRLPCFGVLVLFFIATAWSDDATSPPMNAAPELKGQVLILVGLPGDGEHEKLFAATVKQWRGWLTGKLGFSPAEIHVLFGSAAKNGVA